MRPPLHGNLALATTWGKTGNSRRTNGHLWLWKLFLGNSKSNKLGKTWPRVGKCDGCQQKTGLIMWRKKIKTHRISGVMDNEGQYLYLFGQKRHATSLLDCGQNLKVFTLSVEYYLETAKEKILTWETLCRIQWLQGFGPVCLGSFDGVWQLALIFPGWSDCSWLPDCPYPPSFTWIRSSPSRSKFKHVLSFHHAQPNSLVLNHCSFWHWLVGFRLKARTDVCTQTNTYIYRYKICCHGSSSLCAAAALVTGSVYVCTCILSCHGMRCGIYLKELSFLKAEDQENLSRHLSAKPWSLLHISLQPLHAVLLFVLTKEDWRVSWVIFFFFWAYSLSSKAHIYYIKDG